MDGELAIPGVRPTVVTQLVTSCTTGMQPGDGPVQTKKDVSRSHVRAFEIPRFYRIRSIIAREASRFETSSL
jgi:hypothetical protein